MFDRNLILYFVYDKDVIIQAITEHGFEVRYEKTYTFRPDEIELLVAGSQVLDFNQLALAAEYDGGYTKNSEIIK